MDNPTDRDPAAGVQSTYYVVDVNQNGFYSDGTDYRFELTQTGVPVALGGDRPPPRAPCSTMTRPPPSP